VSLHQGPDALGEGVNGFVLWDIKEGKMQAVIPNAGAYRTLKVGGLTPPVYLHAKIATCPLQSRKMGTRVMWTFRYPLAYVQGDGKPWTNVSRDTGRWEESLCALGFGCPDSATLDGSPVREMPAHSSLQRARKTEEGTIEESVCDTASEAMGVNSVALPYYVSKAGRLKENRERAALLVDATVGEVSAHFLRTFDPERQLGADWRMHVSAEGCGFDIHFTGTKPLRIDGITPASGKGPGAAARAFAARLCEAGDLTKPYPLTKLYHEAYESSTLGKRSELGKSRHRSSLGQALLKRILALVRDMFAGRDVAGRRDRGPQSADAQRAERLLQEHGPGHEAGLQGDPFGNPPGASWS
jgi:hypothetical protein